MSDRVRIPVLYDFASTICYVAHRVLERMDGEIGSLGVELEWRPIDLATISGWRRGAAVEGPPRENALRVARDFEVEPRMPPRWLDSRPAHAVALAIAGGPKEAAWRERVWSAVFEEGRDIGDPAEIARLGQDLAIDAAALADEERLAELARETAAAREGGVDGVPSFLLNGYPFPGIQSPDTMRRVFGRFVEKRRAGE